MKEIKLISCIYKYNAPDGKIYVGATRDYERRIKQYNRKKGLEYQRLLNESISKFGFDKNRFSIIEECNVFDLDKKEIYWIGKLDSYFYNNPNGLNLTIGGKGTKGRVTSVAVKKKLSDIKSIKVYQYSLDGEFIAEYKSAVEAAYITNGNSGDISSCANGTRNKQMSGGFIWRKTKEDKPKLNYKNNFNQKIVQIDLLGNKIAKFNSIIEASNNTKICATNISRCVMKKRKTAGGFCWVKEDDVDNFVYIPKKQDYEKQKIKVSSYDRNMNFIKNFNSIKEAALFYNCSASDISQACKQKHRTVRKMFFRYDD